MMSYICISFLNGEMMRRVREAVQEQNIAKATHIVGEYFIAIQRRIAMLVIHAAQKGNEMMMMMMMMMMMIMIVVMATMIINCCMNETVLNWNYRLTEWMSMFSVMMTTSSDDDRWCQRWKLKWKDSQNSQKWKKTITENICVFIREYKYLMCAIGADTTWTALFKQKKI